MKRLGNSSMAAFGPEPPASVSASFPSTISIGSTSTVPVSAPCSSRCPCCLFCRSTCWWTAGRFRIFPSPKTASTKGDGINFSIAAASIVAKVYRDSLMTELDGSFPGYGFADHKGYATPAHQEAIRRLGPCSIHRKSFDYIRELCGEYSEAFYTLKAGGGWHYGPGTLCRTGKVESGKLATSCPRWNIRSFF